MVYVEGKQGPAIKYDNREEAEIEARRLAAKEMKAAFLLRAEYSFTPEVKVDYGYLCMPPDSKPREESNTNEA